MRVFSLICVFLFGAQIVQAQSTDPYSFEDVQNIVSTEVKSTALTIYPDNLTMVRETRTVDLPAGIVDVQFFGVTDMIIPQSAVLEQFEGLRLEGSFNSDLITPAKLLTRSVGDTITIRRFNPVTGTSDLVDAELVSAAPNKGPGRHGINAVFSTADGVEGFQCSGLEESILLSNLPESLHSVPVLSTRVVSETSGPKDITLTYLTRGIEWSADYRMDVAQDKLEGSLLGWLTLKNETSKSFKDTELAFVAGALNQVKQRDRPPIRRDAYRVSTCMVDSDVTVQYASAPVHSAGFFAGGGDDEVIVTGSRIAKVREATQEAFGDYKLYRAPQAVSMNAHQTKQIAFLFKDKVEYKTSHSWTLSEFEELDNIEDMMEDEIPIHSRLIFEIDNEKDGPLAVPLPRGSLRVMSQRHDGTDVFLGEGSVSNTPVGETVDIKISDSFLVTARFYDVEEAAGGKVSARIELKNASDRKVITEFDFDLLEDISVRQGRKKVSSKDKRYSFTIPAEGTVKLSFQGTML